MAFEPRAVNCLLEDGPRELESLFRAMVFHSCVPILITDNERNYHDANVGAGKLLGVSPEKIIGQRIDDFVEPSFRPLMPELWRNFLQDSKQKGKLRLATADGTVCEVRYTARSNVLPSRHLLVLHDNSMPATKETPSPTEQADSPSWAAEDFALLLFDANGCVVAWYSGAERMYGYSGSEVIGKPASFLNPDDGNAGTQQQVELTRSAAEGHYGHDGWQLRKDGARFWASVMTMALRDSSGELQGFARVVRDFGGNRDMGKKARDKFALTHMPSESLIVGVVSGDFDRIRDANDAFLNLVGYSWADLHARELHWADLTPREFSPLDDLAHEEALRFGACTPYEKELIRQDGTRVPVRVATAVLKLSPFRWIAFVQDLRDRDHVENLRDDMFEVATGFEEIVGNGAPLRRVLRQVEVVAPTEANVLILGETGTGKELVARAIHRLSPRKNLPFVTLNCAAIPTGLLESELFGYEKGAFTGALSQKIGRFEMAHRGTLFLDEVGDIPLDLQPKLLRALQEKSLERLGGTRTIPIDVRLIAATNRDLTQMMAEQQFRRDLYYRLRVFPIDTPALRDHPEDIPALARHFASKYARKMKKKIDKISSDTIRALVRYSWPGNVRELENFIERAVILSRDTELRAPVAEILRGTPEVAGNSTLEHVEREHIIRVLRNTGGVITTAAMHLGMPRTTLNAMMRKLNISRRDV